MTEISKRIPHSKLLKAMTMSQLLIVWKDILYELKQVKQAEKNLLVENYYVYALMVYVYLKKAGSNPNPSYLDVYNNTNFAYLNKYDLWANSANVVNLIIGQHVCNDNKYNIGAEYVAKLLAKQALKGNAIKDDYDEEKLLNLLNDRTTDKALTKTLLAMFRNGDSVEEAVIDDGNKK